MRVQDPFLADSVRVFPPPLVSITIPKWAHQGARDNATLQVSMVPRDQWRNRRWKNALPVLVDAPEDTTFVLGMQNSGASADADLTRWRAEATIEVPPWAVSEEVLGLAQEQLLAIRLWHQRLGIHPMGTLLRRAAAKLGGPATKKPPPEWYQWVQEYQSDETTYRGLVERVYWFRTNGKIPASPPRQPPDAKRSADWVRMQLKTQGVTTVRLPRNWWREVNYRGS